MTVVITFERYMVVAFPAKFGNWFTIRKTRFIVFGVWVWAIIMASPRFSSVYVTWNEDWRSVGATKNTDYLILSNAWEKFWYFDLYGFFDQIDFWGPLPLLLLFNGLVFYYVKKSLHFQHIDMFTIFPGNEINGDNFYLKGAAVRKAKEGIKHKAS